MLHRRWLMNLDIGHRQIYQHFTTLCRWTEIGRTPGTRVAIVFRRWKSAATPSPFFLSLHCPTKFLNVCLNGEEFAKTLPHSNTCTQMQKIDNEMDEE